ncbi:autotransporter outer membrane beta-barrel domain-containing protein, partial [Helicobacter canis]|uniref:hypothetical protein n=1 Tax=Helicobacter canis TaxID=29419 RepID=UPI0014796012
LPHINGGGGGNLVDSSPKSTQTKPTRLSLSLACFFTLGAMMITPDCAEAADRPKVQWSNGGTGGAFGWERIGGKWALTYKTGSQLGGYIQNVEAYLQERTDQTPLGFVSTRVGGRFLWEGQVKVNENTWYDVNIGNSTFNTIIARGYLMSQITGRDNPSTIGTIVNSVKRLALEAQGNGTITIDNFYQQDGYYKDQGQTSEVVIQDNGLAGIVIKNLNQSGGSVYQKGGSVGNATITSGHYYQGYGPSGDGYAPVGDGGQISTLSLQGGAFSQYNGTITNATLDFGSLTQNNGTISALTQNSGAFTQAGGTTNTATLNNGNFTQNNGTTTTLTQNGGNLTQNGGQINTLDQHSGTATQTGGTITALNLYGGVFTHQGGTLNNVVLKAGGSGSTFDNRSNIAIAKITQEYGKHTIYGKVTDFTLNGGTITNNGEITKLTAVDNTSNKYITNNKKIGTLTLESEASITNNAGGTIDTLEVNKGNSTINTLTGVAQNPTSKLSSIDIKQGAASLRVDTLSVGLDGNTAIKRVEINKGNGGGTNKEFAVNTVQINYINGTFDPSKPISNRLKDYVTNGSENYLVQGEVTFKPSPQLDGIGIEFGSDGTPHFDLDRSIAASMTSVVVRQSMRRKMLIDTYLAEQNRRSLKNKERRTKQRIEAATLADAR